MATDAEHIRKEPSEKALQALEHAIGHHFSDRDLLLLALTHSSRANESGERNHHLLCNERMEFLGDAVLSMVVSERLYKKYPGVAEGDLTCMRKEVVCASALGRYAHEIGLGACLRLGVGEDRGGGRDKVNILADAFEALLAAIFLDAGGYAGGGLDAVAAFLLPIVERDLDAGGLEGDYKTPLQQFIQQTDGGVLEYVLVRSEGPDHLKTFEVEARHNSNVIGRGKGRSKRKAEQAAAKAALELFGVE